MKVQKFLFPFVLAAFLVVALGLSGFMQGNEIDRKQLRDMLVQLGYEVSDIDKTPGKEKYSVKITRDGLDIPVGSELSGNSKYLWLTVNLGKWEKPEKAEALLKRNAEIQPTQFYISKSGLLMAGLPVENRGLTNAILRERIESIAANVGKTEDDWGK